jgi:hypothetical protein
MASQDDIGKFQNIFADPSSLIGDELAGRAGRERSTVEGLLDPIDLLGLGKPAKTELQQLQEKIFGARFEGPALQNFLPEALRVRNINPFLDAGINNLSQLLLNPGGINPLLGQSTEERIQSETGLVNQNFENIKAEQAGQAARTNVPVSLKGALSKALDTAQARASREVTQNAVAESEDLRRGDVGQTFNLLDTILNFVSSGRGQAVGGLGAAGQLNLQAQNAQAQQNAALSAGIGSLAQSLSSGFGNNNTVSPGPALTNIPQNPGNTSF